MAIVLAAAAPDEPRRSCCVEAIELVLRSANGEALYYRDIAKQAQVPGEWRPQGRTPWHTANRAIRDEVLRAEAAGEQPRFLRLGRGYIALVPDPDDIVALAAYLRRGVRAELMRRVMLLHPQAFEELIAELLRRMSFLSVCTTRYTRDGGIDMTATWKCAGLLPQRLAVQVKRTQRAIGEKPVRELRGVLDHDQGGLLVCTAGFESAARRVAEDPAKKRIALLGGDELAELLMEHELGVKRQQVDRFDVVGL